MLLLAKICVCGWYARNMASTSATLSVLMCIHSMVLLFVLPFLLIRCTYYVSSICECVYIYPAKKLMQPLDLFSHENKGLSLYLTLCIHLSHDAAAKFVVEAHTLRSVLVQHVKLLR